jgi:undecaprenyl-diphosphatase
MFVVNHLVQLDLLALEAAQAVRWEPLTAFFAFVSVWWIKGPLFVVVGALRDVAQRRLLPLTGLAAAVSLLLADLSATLIKGLVERPRPEFTDPSIAPAVATPADPSFPSGHTTTAFACAVAVSVLHPRYRAPLIGVAALVGVSRLYLGVHFPIDVMAGAAVGTSVGLVTGLAARSALREWRRRRTVAASAEGRPDAAATVKAAA